MKEFIRFGSPLVFIFMVLFFSIAGCVQEPGASQKTSSRPEFGLRSAEGYSEKYPVSLEDALFALHSTRGPDGNLLSDYSIHYIQGTSVDREGYAIHWLIGLKKGNNKVIFNYDSEDQSTIPWSAWFPQESIDLKTTMMPGCFFQKERNIENLFQKDENIYSIEIIGKTYRVNVQTDSGIMTETYSAISLGPCPEPEKKRYME